MCSIPIAMAAVQIVSTVVQAKAASKSADMQEQSISRNYELQTAQTYQQYQQQNQQAAEQMSQRAKESWIEHGRLQAALGESGFQAGGTDQRIVGEAENNAATDIATLENNRSKAEEQTHMQAMGNQASAQSGYNSIQRPSPLGVALQIAGAGMNAFAPKTPTPAPSK